MSKKRQIEITQEETKSNQTILNSALIEFENKYKYLCTLDVHDEPLEDIINFVVTYKRINNYMALLSIKNIQECLNRTFYKFMRVLSHFKSQSILNQVANCYITLLTNKAKENLKLYLTKTGFDALMRFGAAWSVTEEDQIIKEVVFNSPGEVSLERIIQSKGLACIKKKTKLELAIEQNKTLPNYNNLFTFIDGMKEKRRLMHINRYERKCKELNQSPWPITNKILFYIRLIRKTYNQFGIEANLTIIKDEHIRRYGSLSPNLVTIIDHELKKKTTDFEDGNNSNKVNTKPGSGKPPCMYEDLKHILKSIPNGISKQSLWSSIYLFSLYTGARADTLDNMKVNDIVSLKIDNYILYLCLRVTKAKGKRNFHRNYTFTYDIKEAEDTAEMEFVKWFQKYMLETFLFNIFNNTDLSGLKMYKHQQLWNYKSDDNLRLICFTKKQMQTTFRNLVSLAGFKHNFFTLHSLRSGFLCTALNNWKDSKEFIRLMCCLITGWSYKSRMFQTYLKAEYRQQMNMNIGPNPDAKAPLEEKEFSIERFHHLDYSLNNNWSTEKLYKIYIRQFEVSFNINKSQQAIIKKHLCNLYLKKSELHANLELAKKIESSLSGIQKVKEQESIKLKLIQEDMGENLKKNYQQAAKLYNKFLNELLDGIQSKSNKKNDCDVYPSDDSDEDDEIIRTNEIPSHAAGLSDYDLMLLSQDN